MRERERRGEVIVDRCYNVFLNFKKQNIIHNNINYSFVCTHSSILISILIFHFLEKFNITQHYSILCTLKKPAINSTGYLLPSPILDKKPHALDSFTFLSNFCRAFCLLVFLGIYKNMITINTIFKLFLLLYLLLLCI